MTYEWTLVELNKLVLRDSAFSIRRLEYDPLSPGRYAYVILKGEELMSSRGGREILRAAAV